LLSEYLGADLSKISNELSKLALTLGQTKKVTQDDVRNLIGISKEYDVFEFQKVLGMRNFTKANLMIRYFAANPASNPIVMLIANLFAYFNKVAVIKYHQSASDAELAKMAGVTPYYIKDYKSAASHYSFSHLRHIFYTLKEADKMSKGVGSRHADESSILKDILIACMQENRLA
jgi:DNA polymerase-3 subunit delta